jgi:hypothetical protein
VMRCGCCEWMTRAVGAVAAVSAVAVSVFSPLSSKSIGDQGFLKLLEQWLR